MYIVKMYKQTIYVSSLYKEGTIGHLLVDFRFQRVPSFIKSSSSTLNLLEHTIV